MPNYYGASPEEIFAREQQSRQGMTPENESQRQRMIANLMKAGNMDLAYDMAGGPLSGGDSGVGSTLSSQEAWSRTPNGAPTGAPTSGPSAMSNPDYPFSSNYQPSRTGPIVPSTPSARPSEMGGWGAANTPYNSSQPSQRPQQGPATQPQAQAPVINIHVGSGAGAMAPPADQGGGWWDSWKRAFDPTPMTMDSAVSRGLANPPQSPPWQQQAPRYDFPQPTYPSNGQSGMLNNSPLNPYAGMLNSAPPPGSNPSNPMFPGSPSNASSDRMMQPGAPYAGLGQGTGPSGLPAPESQAPWYTQFLDQFQKYLYTPQGNPNNYNNQLYGPKTYAGPGAGPAGYGTR